MDLQDQARVCRVCLKDDMVKKGLSLFQNSKDSLISEHLVSICNVEISKDDGLPSQICPDCFIELETAVNFKIKCQTSNTILLSKKLEYSGNDDDKVEYNPDEIKEEKQEEDFENLIKTEYLEDYFIDDTIEDTEVVVNTEEKPSKEVVVNTEGKPSKAVDLKLICDNCGGSFPSKCKMRVHWKKVHMQEGLICAICKRVFKSYKAYNRHINNKPKGCLAMKNVSIEGTGKSRLFRCKDCPYSSKRTKDMESHLVVHSGDKPFKCLSCDSRFTQLSSMHGHMETVHGVYKVEITCQYCGKFVRGQYAVYKHLKRHKTAGAQCNVCQKVFSNASTLTTHMVRHSGVKKYTCEKCAKTFYTSAELCNHKRLIHNNVKVWYKCDLCEYKAGNAYLIKKHELKHTGNNCACNTCGKFFESAEELALHQPRHLDSAKKFECPFCDKKFYKKDSLKRHSKTKHKCELFDSKPVLVKNEEKQDNEFEKPIVVVYQHRAQRKTLTKGAKKH